MAGETWTNTTLPNAPKLPELNVERVGRLRNSCDTHDPGHVDRMVSDPRSLTTYCVVPKTSCTFWLSMMRFLHRDKFSRKYRSPLDIPRFLLHRSLGVLPHQRIRSNGWMPSQMLGHFRFMFVRDPYSRLWSTYIDKFFLLDFWETDGRKVVKFLTSTHLEQVLGVGEARRNFSKCHSDISFAEFVTFVVGLASVGKPMLLNEHWRPVEHLCDPCLFCPHLVGKTETFHEDSLNVLHRLNLTWAMGGYDHHLHQMQLLVEENFDQLGEPSRNKAFYTQCTNASLVAQRLWSAFQMYGYIPDSAPYPAQLLDQGPPLTADKFKDVLLNTYKAIPKSEKKQLSQQRSRAMQRAYRTVPVNVLERLPSLYSYEFSAFEYESRPPELFEGRD